MLKRIYHGSERIIETPAFGYGKSYNDYGLGFYCTESLDMAKEWASSKDHAGYANIYDLDMSGLTLIDLNSEEHCILHWLSVLLSNRQFAVSAPLAREAKEYLLNNFSVNYDAYDLIVGYRADDSYFSFAQDFISGAISYRQLSSAMRLGQLGQQIVLKSRKAFEHIQYKGYEFASAEEWYEKKMLRDRNARAEYFNTERNGRMRGDIYITQILDEEMTADDPRLR